MKGYWKAREDDVLRANYGAKTASQIASMLGRTRGAVYQRARVLGLATRLDKDAIATRKITGAQLLAEGLCDSEIAAILGCKRRGFSKMRALMGLPASGRNQRYRKKVSERTKRQCQEGGFKNLAEVRAKRFGEAAVKLGWPGVSLRAAQIASVLNTCGPMTRKQIVKAIGMKWMGSRKSLSNSRVPGGSYMAELVRAGYVVRLQNAITHSGKGYHEDVYMTAIGVD